MKLFVPGSAKSWICPGWRPSCGPHLGKFASAEDVLYPVFKEINYLTYEELKSLNVKLAKLDQEATGSSGKSKREMPWWKNKMYVKRHQGISAASEKRRTGSGEARADYEYLAQSWMCVQLSVSRWRRLWSASGRRFSQRVMRKS